MGCKKRMIIYIILAVLLIGILIFIGLHIKKGYDSMRYIEIKGPFGEVSHHTELQAAYLADNYENVTQYVNGNLELSLPEAIKLDWDFLDSEISVDHYIIEIGTDKNLVDADEYTSKYSTLSLYNLDLATTYYWRVTAIDENDLSYVSEIAQFSTSATAPRILNVPGVSNARDIGGWRTAGGKEVSTEKIFRTANLEDIRVEGMEVLLNDFGVKTEIEFRQWITADAGSKLGDECQFFVCSVNADALNLMQSNAGETISQSTRDFFEILADGNNYPIIMHCGGGMDRTGYFSFVLNGLLGVVEEDLYRDYMLSGFCYIATQARPSSTITEYLEAVNAHSGDTLQERFYNYLHTEHGVPTEHLDSVIEIMLGK